MSNVPRFDFSNMGLKTDEALKDALKADAPASDKFFKPGRHEVVVLTSKRTGSASDPNWDKYQVEYEGTGGKTVRDTVLVPLRDLSYNSARGEPTMFLGRKIMDFLGALGEKATIANLGDLLTRYFDKDNLLTGLNVAVDIGYRGIHTKYLGKKDGKVQIGLVTKDDQVIEGTPTFNSDKEALTWAEDRKPPMQVRTRPEIVGYAKSSTPNKPKVDTNW